MHNEALGMIETFGHIAAVEALDASLKSADVKFAGCEFIGGGLVTVKITGDVSAVNTSVKAGEAAAGRIGKVISAFVISRPADEVFDIFCSMKKENLITEEKPDEESKFQSQNGTGTQEEKIQEKEELQEKVKEIEPPENILLLPEKTEINRENSAGDGFRMRQRLEKMKVVDLRNMARKMNLNSLTKRDIKFGKKRQLIKAILEYYTRRPK